MVEGFRYSRPGEPGIILIRTGKSKGTRARYKLDGNAELGQVESGLK